MLEHDLKADRFFEPQILNGLIATAQGPINTFPLRGIKDSPPHFHDGRLPILQGTEEFFSLVFEIDRKVEAKADLVAFVRQL